jgi:hypothetical protein
VSDAGVGLWTSDHSPGVSGVGVELLL